MVLASFINLIVVVTVVDAECLHYQDLEIGKEYYIRSPDYPNKYPAGTSCKYIAQSPFNTKIELNCEDIDIPDSPGCETDRLLVSLIGDDNLQDANNTCGGGELRAVSFGNRIAVGLFSSWYSKGGRLECMLTVEKPAGCDCGWRQERRIVGGVETGINEFPLMAGLVDRNEVYCGASIIAIKYAISAAHCVINRAAQNLSILVGDHNIPIANETSWTALYLLEKVEMHPYYNSKTNENDIAVVKTWNIIHFSMSVGPVCLPFRYSNQKFDGSFVTALGWGSTSHSGPKSDYLQKVNLTVVTNQYCQQELKDDKISAGHICTDGGTSKDACQYDSGGPVLWFDYSTRRLHLVGIISFGNGCASGFPSVNTRVTSYLDWIHSVTRDTELCTK